MVNRNFFSDWGAVRWYIFLIIFLCILLSAAWPYFIPIAVIIIGVSIYFARHSERSKQVNMTGYLDDVIRNIERTNHFATRNLDIAMAVFSAEGNLQWKNEKFVEWTGQKKVEGKRPEELLPLGNDSFETMCVKDDEKNIEMNGRFYKIRYFSVAAPVGNKKKENINNKSSLMLYMRDITEYENLCQKERNERLCVAHIRFDNYEDVMKGLSESARANVDGAVSELITGWVEDLGGFVWRGNKESILACLNYEAMTKAVEDKFAVLDKVHEVHQENKLTPTLSIGMSTDGETINEVGLNAAKALDLALGRGGDQAVVESNKKLQYFGGTSTVTAKSTRVRARIVAHTIHEQMEMAEKVFVMGHANEDYDALGGAIGVAKMALALGKPTFIVVSGRSTSLDKLESMVLGGNVEDPDEGRQYLNIIVEEEAALKEITPKSLLMLVDHHRKVLCASKKVFEAIPENRIIIDHHRRAEDVIQDTILQYMEPSSSSTCELVTELVGYFDSRLEFTKDEATALYAGLVVDTKNFNVQTGERTFEAAALLRRSGADPTLVRQLFKDDFYSLKERYRLIAEAENPLPGLAISINRGAENNSQTSILAAQAADALVCINEVSVGVVINECTDGTVSVSARSDGSVNVQVIMEELGGGGHQTVAGVQLKNVTADAIKQQIIDLTKKQFDEAEERLNNESNIIG